MSLNRYRTAPKNTASLYCRLSEESGPAQTGLASQEQDLRGLAARYGLTVVEVRIDDGLSGALRNRPEFLAWLQDARDCRVDHLLAWKLDRVSRGGSAGLAEFLDTIEGVDRDGKRARSKVRFLSAADSLDSQSPAWDIQASVMGALAKSERDAISTRVKRSRQALAAQDRFGGGTPPFGFRPVDNPSGPGRVLEPVPEEVEALREAARIFTTETLKAATRWLNHHSGVKPRRAEGWTRQTLAGTLTSDQSRKIFSAAERREISKKLTPKSTRAESDRLRTGRDPSRLLSGGILKCGGCGRNMYVATRSPGNKSYKCRATIDDQRCEHRATASARLIEEAVEAAWLDGWGAVSETIVVRVADEHRERIAVLANEIEAHQRRLATANRAERRELSDLIDRLEDELELAEMEPSSDISRLVETGRTYGDAWRDGDLEDTRRLLRRTVGSLHVGPGKPGARSFDMTRILDADKLDPS